MGETTSGNHERGPDVSNRGMRALIISGQGVQDAEFIYPFYRLAEAGYAVDVAAPEGVNFTGIAGVKCVANMGLDFHAVESLAAHYDVLIIPGGVKCMEHLRLQKNAIRSIADYYRAGGVIGAICSGVQMLITAKVIERGMQISAYYAMQVDVENAGAVFVDAPAVVDTRIITSPHYKYLGPWMAAVLSEVRKHSPRATDRRA